MDHGEQSSPGSSRRAPTIWPRPRDRFATGPGRELRGVDLSTIVRGHLDIYGSLANPRGISGRGLQLIARGVVDVRPLITHHFPLAQFAEAWATFVERRAGAIRVMLHP